MKRKIFTLLLGVILGTAVMAQDPEGVVKKTPVAPVIDGAVDAIWYGANKYNIVIPFKSEEATVGDPGATSWRALWDDMGVYVLVQVKDDYWFSSWVNGSGNSYEYDKLELYFDTNLPRKDGQGGQNNRKGSIQVAPDSNAEIIIGTMGSGSVGFGTNYNFAYLLKDPTYAVEYFIPWDALVDKDDAAYDKANPMGFDVTVIDRDPGDAARKRVNWANAGGIDENWGNMDDAGTITFSEELAVAANIVMKAETKPEIDGVVDAVWANAVKYNIAVPFKTEMPTLGAEGETSWKALWDAEGMYMLLQVADDNWYPNWVAGGGDNYMFDKPELYFKTNTPFQDATGGRYGTKGSIQVAPASTADNIDGTIGTGESGVGTEYNYAFKVTDPTYVVEYFLPWGLFINKDDVPFDPTTSMAFDVTIIDRDPGDTDRKRMNWLNTGAFDESWSNMNEAGIIMFDGADQVEIIDIEKVKVAGGTITTDNGTLQMVATIEPEDATFQKVKWSVENGTGRATIDGTGVLTGVMDGTVTVKAVTTDGNDTEAKATVTISGQIVEMGDINMLKNSYFEKGADGKQDWGGPGVVADSWYNLECVTKVNIWDTMFGQPNVKIADGETPYTVKFKAFASADMAVPMLFEDRSNGNNKVVTSLMEYRDNGYGKWDVPVTTEEKWFTIDVIFSAHVENSAWELNFQAGMVDGTLSIDSIMMYADADLALLSSVKTLSNVNKVKLYPNPVQTELTISKIAVPNSKVSVYNFVGQKLMEKTANGNQAKFDVANLRKGMYFVRFSDGSSEKFLKQ
jgi:hypothetical protein